LENLVLWQLKIAASPEVLASVKSGTHTDSMILCCVKLTWNLRSLIYVMTSLFTVSGSFSILGRNWEDSRKQNGTPHAFAPACEGDIQMGHSLA